MERRRHQINTATPAATITPAAIHHHGCREADVLAARVAVGLPPGGGRVVAEAVAGSDVAAVADGAATAPARATVGAGLAGCGLAALGTSIHRSTLPSR
jgi:hypothetical protein